MTYLSTRMTVCHMAKQPFGDAEMAVPLLLQLAVVVNTYWKALRLPGYVLRLLLDAHLPSGAPVRPGVVMTKPK